MISKTFSPPTRHLYDLLPYEYDDNPLKYWEKYSSKGNIISLIGNRGTIKMKVAEQISKSLNSNTKKITSPKGLKDIFESDENNCYLLSNTGIQLNRQTQIDMTESMMAIIQALRTYNNQMCLVAPFLESIDEKILNNIHEVLSVKKTLPNYHIVEHITFGAYPASMLIKPPSFNDVNEYLNFKCNFVSDTTLKVEKYPRKKGDYVDEKD